MRRGHVAAARIEIAHQHDILAGDASGLVPGQNRALGSPVQCGEAHLHAPLLADVQVDVVESVDLRHRIQRGRVQGDDGKLLDL